MVWFQTQTYCVVPQHAPFSLYTNHKGLLIEISYFYFPWYDLRMIFRGPQILMVMALGLSVKRPLHHIYLGQS